MRGSLIATLALVLVYPSAAAAHGEGEPWLLVPAERVEQGEPFTVFGEDMAPSARVAMDLLAHGETLPLTDLTTAADGHFQAAVVVPPTVPDGYAELRAVDAAGLEASTWILVGDSVDPAVAGPPPAAGGSAWWSDPSVIVLGLLVGGAGLAMLYLLLKARSRDARSHAPARVAVGDRSRSVPRKPAAGKRRRSH